MSNLDRNSHDMAGKLSPLHAPIETITHEVENILSDPKLGLPFLWAPTQSPDWFNANHHA